MNNYKKIILNNGIPLYLYTNPSMKQVYVSYIIRYGSTGEYYRFNESGKDHIVTSGYAHYLEHLLGEHAKNGNMYTNFSKKHYSANAYTAQDHTCYHFKGIDKIDESIEELITSIDEPVFDDKDVNQTRHAIEEEASSRCDDTNIMITSSVENNLYSGFSSYDETLCSIGNRETTRLINTDDLYNCYNAFYSDDRKCLVIAGNLDEKRVVELLNNIYSKIKPHKSTLILPSYDYEPIRKRQDTLYRNIDGNLDCVGIKFKKLDDISMKELYYCLYVLNMHLLDYDSEFFNTLRSNGLLDTLHYCYFSNVNDYINYIHSFVSRDKDEYYKRLFDKLNKRDITKEDYELLRKCIIAEEVKGLDDKYASPKEFGSHMYYTQEYSDIPFYKSMDYERFMSILNRLSFDDFSTTSVMKLTRTK